MNEACKLKPVLVGMSLTNGFCSLEGVHGVRKVKLKCISMINNNEKNNNAINKTLSRL